MNKWKRTIKKAKKNSVCWVVAKKKSFLLEWHFLKKIGKHYLCSEGTKNAHFRCNYLFFFENGPFFGALEIKVTKHYKNRGFSRHRGKPKMALLVATVPFLGFPSKGGLYYLWYLEAVLCWKHYFYSVCSNTALQTWKSVTWKKNTKTIRGCLPKCKKLFFRSVFLVFWWFCFFFLCVFVLVFC